MPLPSVFAGTSARVPALLLILIGRRRTLDQVGCPTEADVRFAPKATQVMPNEN